MASHEQQLSMNLPAPKTFAPSREDVLSTLGFFFGDPGTPAALSPSNTRQLLCAEVRVALPARYHRRFACVCRLSFVTAVPEKLKDYSEHHAMYAPPREPSVCRSGPCTVPKTYSWRPSFPLVQDLPLPGWCAPRGPSRSHLTH